MRVIETFPDHFMPGTFAVIVNPIAGGIAGLPALRYRLIRSSSPHWKREINTMLSVSRTPGVVICQTFDVIEAWAELPSTKRKLAGMMDEARLRSGVLYQQQLAARRSK